MCCILDTPATWPGRHTRLLVAGCSGGVLSLSALRRGLSTSIWYQKCNTKWEAPFWQGSLLWASECLVGLDTATPSSVI